MESSPKLAVALLLAAIAPYSLENSPQDFIDAHNAACARHGRQNRCHGTTLWLHGRSPTRSCAPLIASSCTLRRAGHMERTSSVACSGANWTAADALKEWVSEKQYYDHDSNTCSVPAGESCEHTTRRWCGANRQLSATPVSSVSTSTLWVSSAATTRRAISTVRVHTWQGAYPHYN